MKFIYANDIPDMPPKGIEFRYGARIIGRNITPYAKNDLTDHRFKPNGITNNIEKYQRDKEEYFRNWDGIEETLKVKRND